MTREEYRKAPLLITDKEIRLGNEQIMWIEEKDLIQAQAKDIIKKYKPKSVLEIGYGLGLTAEIFKQVDRHLILEAHPKVAQIARDKGYDVVETFSNDFKTDEEFDVIYDDRHEFLHEEDPITENVKHKHYIKYNLQPYAKHRFTKRK